MSRNNVWKLKKILQDKRIWLLAFFLGSVFLFCVKGLLEYKQHTDTAKQNQTPNDQTIAQTETESIIASENLIIGDKPVLLSKKYLVNNRLTIGSDNYYLDEIFDEREEGTMRIVTETVYIKDQQDNIYMQLGTDIATNEINQSGRLNYTAFYAATFTENNKAYVVVSKDGESELWIVDLNTKTFLSKRLMPKVLPGSGYYFSKIWISPDRSMLTLEAQLADAGMTNLQYVYKLSENEITQLIDKDAKGFVFYLGWYDSGIISVEIVQSKVQSQFGNNFRTYRARSYSPAGVSELLFEVKAQKNHSTWETGLYDNSIYLWLGQNSENKSLYKYSFQEKNLTKLIELGGNIRAYQVTRGKHDGLATTFIQLEFTNEAYVEAVYPEYYQKFYDKNYPAFFVVNEKQFNTITPVKFID